MCTCIILYNISNLSYTVAKISIGVESAVPNSFKDLFVIAGNSSHLSEMKGSFSFNSRQRAILWKTFQVYPYPKKALRNDLSIKLGVKERYIRNWYNNQRKRLYRRSHEFLAQGN